MPTFSKAEATAAGNICDESADEVEKANAKKNKPTAINTAGGRCQMIAIPTEVEIKTGNIARRKRNLSDRVPESWLSNFFFSGRKVYIPPDHGRALKYSVVLP